MVLVSLKTEGAVVNVRVDDLVADERVRVNEAIRIIQRIVGRIGAEVVSFFIGFVAWIVIFLALVHGKTNADLPSTLVLSLGLGFFVGYFSGGILRAVIESRNSTDATALTDILRVSQRSKELYAAFLDASRPSIRSVFKRIMLNIPVAPAA